MCGTPQDHVDESIKIRHRSQKNISMRLEELDARHEVELVFNNIRETFT